MPLCQHGSEGVESRLVRVALHTARHRPAPLRRAAPRSPRSAVASFGRRTPPARPTQPRPQASKIFPSSLTEEPNLCFSLFSNSTMPRPGSARSRRFCPTSTTSTGELRRSGFTSFHWSSPTRSTRAADLAQLVLTLEARGQLPPVRASRLEPLVSLRPSLLAAGEGSHRGACRIERRALESRAGAGDSGHRERDRRR